jgi:hypothetical protein
VTLDVMSMSEPLLPASTESEKAPAAAEPGPAAPGTPLTEDPDVLPDASGEQEEEVDRTLDDEQDDPPFRTPDPGERLTASDLEERS